MVLSNVDTLFVTTMNDQLEIYNLHLFPVKGIKSFKRQMSRIDIINAYECTAYNSIAFNIIPTSPSLEKQYKHEINKLIDQEDSSIWTVLHYRDGEYKELYQAKFP